MGPSSTRLWWCLPGTPIHEGHRLTAYLASERTVVNLTFTFPFSTNRSAGWTGKNLTDNETSTAWSRCTPSCGHPHTSTHNNEFVPLASPVENRVYEGRSTYSARQVNSVASASSSPRVQPIQLDPSPGRMRQRLKVPSTTPPTLLHLQHDFLDT